MAMERRCSRGRFWTSAGSLRRAEGVGYGATVLAGATGDVVVAEVELAREAVEGMGDFDGVEILALYVLDQRDFEQVLIGNMLYHGWDVGKAASFPARQRRSPATS